MNDWETLLYRELEQEFESNLVRWDSGMDTYVHFLEDSFPFVGSKIDWDNVSDVISERAGKLYIESGVHFFLKICEQENLEGECILVSDSAFDTALLMSLDTLKKCLKNILDFPHHLYVLSNELEWCVVFTSCGYFDFGRSKKGFQK